MSEAARYGRRFRQFFRAWRWTETQWPLQRRLSSTQWSLLVVLLCGLCSLWPTVKWMGYFRAKDIVMDDPVDSGLLVAGLQRVQGWADVAAWWYGPWVAGPTNKFYRPLTSMIWYGEYRLFGFHGLVGFQLVHYLSHLLVLVVLWLFLSELLNRRLATLTVCLFTMSTPYYFFGFPVAAPAMPMWKDSPEMWFSTATLLALWAYRRYLRAGEGKVEGESEPHNARRYWWYALLAFVVGVLFKETAYITPLLLPLLLWHEGKIKTHWKSVLPFYGVALLLVAFRFWALQGTGFRFGSNGAWKDRWFINVVGGFPGAQILMSNWLSLSMACLVIALFFLYRRSWRSAIAFFIASTIALLVMWQQWDIVEVPFYYVLLGNFDFWWVAFYTLLLLVAYGRFVVNRRPGQVVAWLWVVISYLPLMTAPITSHALYFVSIGWSLWLAYFLTDVYGIVKAKMRSLTPYPSPAP